MKVSTLASLALLSAAVSAAAPRQYHVKAQILMDGKLLSNPTISTIEGELSEISQKGSNTELTFKVTPSDKSDRNVRDRIQMDVDFKYMAGGTTITASKRILARPGVESVIDVGENANGKRVQLKVSATRL